MEVTPRGRGSPRRACDHCRRRKIRCNRELPCDKCQEIDLLCQYNDIQRRKGPKGPTAPVLTSLRSTLEQDGPSAQNHECEPVEDGFSKIPGIAMASLNDNLQSEDYDASFLMYGLTPCAPAPIPRRISSPQLQAHIQVFLNYLYPIMPVVDGNALLQDSANPETLTARRYALLAAISAAAHFQLNLDMPEGNTGFNPSQSQDSLINEAVQSLHQYDPLDEPHIDTLLAMFFVFAAYGNLRKRDQAWYFLNQSISFAYILQLNEESTYATLSQNEADIKRRIYWLLFITER